MIALAKAFAVANLVIAWLLGVPVAVGLATTPDLGFLAFVGTLAVSGLTYVLAIEVFD